MIVKRASIKQVRTLQYLSQGMSKRQAMIKAGYSISSANQATRVLASKSMNDLIYSFGDKLLKIGLTPDYMVEKIKEWFKATKLVNGREVPDYEIQLRTHDIWREYMSEIDQQPAKRKITLEEWLRSEQKTTSESSSEEATQNHLSNIDPNLLLTQGEPSNETLNQQEIVESVDSDIIETAQNQQLEPVFDESWRELVNWPHFNSFEMIDLKKEELVNTLNVLSEYETNRTLVSPEFTRVKEILVEEAKCRGY